jgi:hypothetical protein
MSFYYINSNRQLVLNPETDFFFTFFFPEARANF